MKRIVSVLAVAGAVLLFATAAAFAGGHGQAPAELSFGDTLGWEFDHFVMHMSMTYQAIQLMVISPALGWDMLGDNARCADMGHLTAHLFDTTAHALLSFMLTLAAAVAAVTWSMLWLARRIHTRRFWRPALASAMT